MKNRNFIEQHRNLSQEGYKKNQNIIYDNWVLYSYGKHYPLLFKVGDVVFCNKRKWTQKESMLLSGLQEVDEAIAAIS